jgi:hypothetical protein
MGLNLDAGWSLGDDVRVLIAAGLPVGVYQAQQVVKDMNYIASQVPQSVSGIIDLLDEYDAAQGKLKELNATMDGRVLTKVDVLEWSVAQGGVGYSPEKEMMRIRGLLYQYFASSVLFSGMLGSQTALIRS